MTGKRGLYRIAAASARPGTVPVFLELPRTPLSFSGSNPPGNRGRNPDSKGQSNVRSVPASNGPSDPLR